MCTGEVHKTVMVYNTNGQLENKMKAHSNIIQHMCLVRETNDVMTAAADGCCLFNLPTAPDDDVGKESAEGGKVTTFSEKNKH